jgi:PAS domain-containing protein
MANDKTATNLQDQSFPPSQALEQTLLSEAMIEEQSFRLIIDRIPGQIAVMTAGGQVELVNRQILEYFGKTTEELKNWATSDSFHPDDILPTIDA